MNLLKHSLPPTLKGHTQYTCLMDLNNQILNLCDLVTNLILAYHTLGGKDEF